MKNKIKIFGLVMLFFFIAPQAYSQKCKFDIDKNDPFTGKGSKGITAKINNQFFLGLNKNGNEYDITLLARYILCTETSIKGDAIVLKVVNAQNPNGVMLTLYSAANVEPILQQSTAVQYNTTTASASSTLYGTYRIKYEITEKQLELLSSGLVTDIKFSIKGKDFGILNIKKKASEKLQQAANCILQ